MAATIRFDINESDADVRVTEDGGKGRYYSMSEMSTWVFGLLANPAYTITRFPKTEEGYFTVLFEKEIK